MDPIEFLSIGGGIFELLGIYFLGVKNKIGFISNLLGNITWITYATLSNSAYGLYIVCSLGLYLNIKGYRNWKASTLRRKDESKDN